jgi:hypothetical protein
MGVNFTISQGKKTTIGHFEKPYGWKAILTGGYGSYDQPDD